MSREAIMGALFSAIASSTAWATTSRRWQNWQDDPTATPPALPMLILWEGLPDAEDASYKRERGLPVIQTFNVRALIYARIPGDPLGAYAGPPDRTTPGASVINPLMDVVEAALRPTTADGTQTLGGLVSDARIEGVTTKVLGDNDPSGICAAVIPIKILVTR